MILHGPMYSVLLMISFPLIVNNLIMTLYNTCRCLLCGAAWHHSGVCCSIFCESRDVSFSGHRHGCSDCGNLDPRPAHREKQQKEAKEYAYHVIPSSVGLLDWFSVGLVWSGTYIIQFMGGESRGSSFHRISEDHFPGCASAYPFYGVHGHHECPRKYEILHHRQQHRGGGEYHSGSIFHFFRNTPIRNPWTWHGGRRGCVATSIAHVVLMFLGYYMMRKTSKAFSV